MPGARGSTCTSRPWWRVCGWRRRAGGGTRGGRLRRPPPGWLRCKRGGGAAGGGGRHEVRTLATTAAGLLALQEWLVAAGCTHAVLESTGVYGRVMWATPAPTQNESGP